MRLTWRSPRSILLTQSSDFAHQAGQHSLRQATATPIERHPLTNTQALTSTPHVVEDTYVVQYSEADRNPARHVLAETTNRPYRHGRLLRVQSARKGIGRTGPPRMADE